MRALPLTLALIACTPHMEDNSLEAQDLGDLETGEIAAAPLGVVAGQEEGDWELTLGETVFDLHTPGHADLSLLSGRELSAEIDGTWGGPDNLTLWEGEDLAFFVGIGDGSSQLGETRWSWNEIIGQGEVVREVDSEPELQELSVLFYDVVVHTDDGDVIALPGEPLSVSFDGVSYRLVVVAAYDIDHGFSLLGAESCGPSGVLLVELIRTEEDPGEPLFRPSAARAPTAGCG